MNDAVGLRTFVYDPGTLQLTDEVIDGQGAFDGVYDLTIKRKYEGSVTGLAGRSGGLQLLQGGTTPYDVTYGYESTGRFNSVAWTVDPGTGVVSDQAGYTYVPNSDLLDSMFTTSGQTTTYGYEPSRDLKTLVRNEFDAGSGPVLVSQYDYAYDNLGGGRA